MKNKKIDTKRQKTTKTTDEKICYKTYICILPFQISIVTKSIRKKH